MDDYYEDQYESNRDTEYWERLLEATRELSIISSNSANPSVVSASTRAYNAVVDRLKDDEGFMNELIK